MPTNPLKNFNTENYEIKKTEKMFNFLKLKKDNEFG